MSLHERAGAPEAYKHHGRLYAGGCTSFSLGVGVEGDLRCAGFRLAEL